MSLTPAERIKISEKIVSIPIDNASSTQIKADLDVAKDQATDKDNGNKKLAEPITALIDSYQDELNTYDGNGRTKVVEQDYRDSIDRVLQNPFFPNDPNTPTPALTNGIWTQFTPYAGNKAIGKTYLETYSVVDKEQDKIDAINSIISVVEGFTAIQRSSGQTCFSANSCSLPAYTTEPTCTGNGGVWYSVDTIETYLAVQNALSDLVSAVSDWESFITTTYGLVNTTDNDPTKSAENIASKDDIANTQSVIDTWQGLGDFDTSHGQTTCAGFNGYDVSLLSPTKLRAAELQLLKDEITARQSFISVRISQLNGYLGGVVQDLSDGSITSKSGLYGQRFGFIDLRLNLITGSFSEIKGIEESQNAQDQIINANTNAGDTYSGVMLVTLLRSPAAGTSTLHVIDATGFNIGDSVYVCGDNQPEISATISNIDINTIYLDINIPKKYTRDIRSRMYKMY